MPMIRSSRPRFPLRVLLALSFLAPLAPPVRAAAPSASSGLETALATVDPDAIRADLAFIASDELRGRDTPSEGLRIAARYIVARLERLGFEPGAADGFLYRYPLAVRGPDFDACRITVRGADSDFELRLGEDYFPRSFRSSEPSAVEGPVVFAGGGSEEELDSLGEERLRGAWLLIADRGESLRRARRVASRAEAAGLLVYPGPEYDGEAYPERFADSLRWLRQGTVSFIERRAGGDEQGDDSRRRRWRFVPQLHLTREAAQRLFAASPARPGEAGADWRPALGADLRLTLTEHRVPRTDGTIEVENVCGFWPGKHPELAKEVILLSAHYDHVGERDGEIYNGADDNGSGTCGLLAIADALAARGPLERSVMLIWVSGEEKGLWGSRAWAADPWLPEGCRLVCDLNMDMIGRNAPDELYLTPSPEHEGFNPIARTLLELAPLEGFPTLASADEYYYRSDQASFAKLGIPVAFLFAGVHEDYHQPSDEVEKIDFDKIRRVVRLELRLIDALQRPALPR